MWSVITFMLNYLYILPPWCSGSVLDELRYSSKICIILWAVLSKWMINDLKCSHSHTSFFLVMWLQQLWTFIVTAGASKDPRSIELILVVSVFLINMILPFAIILQRSQKVICDFSQPFTYQCSHLKINSKCFHQIMNNAHYFCVDFPC